MTDQPADATAAPSTLRSMHHPISLWPHVTRVCALLVIAAASACAGPDAHAQAGPAATPPATQPAAASPAHVQVRPHLGRPTVFVDGQPLPLIAYSPATRGASFHAATPRFFQHNLTAYFVNVPRGKPADGDDWAASPFWVGDAMRPEYQLPLASPSLEDQARIIGQGDPDAYLIVRFGLLEPASWRKLHPDQLIVTETGERLDAPSLASDAWWDACARYVQTIVQYCETQPWSDRVIGYANFMRHEGTHEAVLRGWLYDHSPLMTQRFRQFLRDRYGSDEALRAAWHDDSVTLDTVTVPRDKLRGSVGEVSKLLYWQPAAQNQPMRDYLQLQAELFHAGLRKVAAAGPAATDRSRFFVYDALKQHMLGWHNFGFFDPSVSWPLTYHDMMAGSGHMNVAPLLDAPGVNGLITPHEYEARGIGGVFLPEGIADSAVLRGDLFLAEMDTRSYTGVSGRRFFAARDDAEFAAVTWRNLATAITHGYTAYYMDVFTDWFASESIQSLIGQQVEVLHEAANWPHAPVPGIAVIIDDAAVLETNGDGRYHKLAVMWQPKLGLARCGVPFVMYTLEDLARDDFPDHRVFYFPNLFKVTDERLALLREKVFRDGRVVLWGPGSGISDGETIGPEHARRLTGFTFDWLPANMPRRVIVTDFDHPITRDADADTLFGDSLAYGPMLLPTSGRELGGIWTKQGLRYPGLVVQSHGRGGAGEADDAADLGPGDWVSVFTTALPVPADLWRGLARLGGAHVYTDTHDVVLANTSLVAVHTVKAGPRTIRLPRPARVTNVITGDLVAERTDTIPLDAAAPSTHLFHLAGP